jgi:hypothetical protein
VTTQLQLINIIIISIIIIIIMYTTAQNTRYEILLHAGRLSFGVSDQPFIFERFVASHVQDKKCPTTVLSEV